MAVKQVLGHYLDYLKITIKFSYLLMSSTSVYAEGLSRAEYQGMRNIQVAMRLKVTDQSSSQTVLDPNWEWNT